MANFKRAAKRRKYARRQRKRYGGKGRVVSDITILKGKMRDFRGRESKHYDAQALTWNSALPEDDDSMIYQEVTDSGLLSNETRFVGLLNNIEAGNDFDGRIGRQIYQKYITIRGTIFPRRMGSNSGSFATQTQTTCRTIILWDNCPNGKFFTLRDIFVSATNGTVDTFTSQSMLNLNYRERFEILYDRTVVLGPMSVVATNTPANVVYSTGNGSVPLKIHLKLRRTTTYLAQTTAGLDVDEHMISSGALYIITLGNATVDEGASTWTNGGQLTFNARLRYTDS